MALDLTPFTGIPAPVPGRPNSNVYLFVSIYLMLFAFFVVLNTMSSQNKARIEAAIGSVNATFKPQKQPRSAFVDLIARNDKVVGDEEFPNRVYEMFESQIDIPGYGASRDGNLLRITLPAVYLFNEFDPEPRSDRIGFLDRLAAAVRGVAPGYRNEIHLTIGTGAELPDPGELADDLAIRRAGAFAVDMGERGIAAEDIAVGVHHGDPGILFLSFVTRAMTTAPAPSRGPRAGQGFR